MATQTLEFSYVPDQTLTAKLFAIGSDTVVQTASAVTEAVNRDGRYLAVFTDVPAGNYQMQAYLGGAGAISENYSLLLATDVFQPWSELNPSSGGGGGGGGTGEFLQKFTIMDADSNVVPYCEVVITETSTGDAVEVYATGVCNSAGKVEIRMNAGTYYLWRNKLGYEFTDPVAFSINSLGVLTLL